MKKPFVVDYNKKDAGLQIFPSKPLLSSQKIRSSKKNRFDNIQVEHYELDSHEAPEHMPAQNAIVIFHEPVLVNRRLGDQCKDDYVKAGDIVISPANVLHSACWNGRANFTLLLLKPEYFSHIAFEHINPERSELLPSFAQEDPFVYGAGQNLKSQLQSQDIASRMYIDQLASCLFIHLTERYGLTKHKLSRNIHSFSAAELQQALDYFDDHINQNIGLAEISNLLGMSQYHFARLFKKAIGIPPAQYFMKRRLKKTAHLLATTSLDLGLIAEETGFTDQSHLYRTFCQHLLVTPRQYRRRL
jgi:AraC family transcriptional regulator